ncbi:unnamed protein product [Heligmosomoides polygyrus]|uniref:Transposase n=1 Tax=Heligmosomoides polygyrus TaxID=6339 RepID=A0A183FPG4_HELPZ|nr:unnamed protein product [Heligmosomoides polygyrus]
MDDICGTMGLSTVSYDAAKVWSREFKKGDSCLRTNQVWNAVNEVRLLELAQEDLRRRIRELAEELECGPVHSSTPVRP